MSLEITSLVHDENKLKRKLNQYSTYNITTIQKFSDIKNYSSSNTKDNIDSKKFSKSFQEYRDNLISQMLDEKNINQEILNIKDLLKDSENTRKKIEAKLNKNKTTKNFLLSKALGRSLLGKTNETSTNSTNNIKNNSTNPTTKNPITNMLNINKSLNKNKNNSLLSNLVTNIISDINNTTLNNNNSNNNNNNNIDHKNLDSITNKPKNFKYSIHIENSIDNKSIFNKKEDTNFFKKEFLEANLYENLLEEYSLTYKSKNKDDFIGILSKENIISNSISTYNTDKYYLNSLFRNKKSDYEIIADYFISKYDSNISNSNNRIKSKEDIELTRNLISKIDSKYIVQFLYYYSKDLRYIFKDYTTKNEIHSIFDKGNKNDSNSNILEITNKLEQSSIVMHSPNNSPINKKNFLGCKISFSNFSNIEELIGNLFFDKIKFLKINSEAKEKFIKSINNSKYDTRVNDLILKNILNSPNEAYLLLNKDLLFSLIEIAEFNLSTSVMENIKNIALTNIDKNTLKKLYTSYENIESFNSSEFFVLENFSISNSKSFNFVLQVNKHKLNRYLSLISDYNLNSDNHHSNRILNLIGIFPREELQEDNNMLIVHEINQPNAISTNNNNVIINLNKKASTKEEEEIYEEDFLGQSNEDILKEVLKTKAQETKFLKKDQVFGAKVLNNVFGIGNTNNNINKNLESCENKGEVYNVRIKDTAHKIVISKDDDNKPVGLEYFKEFEANKKYFVSFEDLENYNASTHSKNKKFSGIITFLFKQNNSFNKNELDIQFKDTDEYESFKNKITEIFVL